MSGVGTADGNALLPIGLRFDHHCPAAQGTGGKATVATISKMIRFSPAKKLNVYSAKSLEFHFKLSNLQQLTGLFFCTHRSVITTLKKIMVP